MTRRLIRMTTACVLAVMALTIESPVSNAQSKDETRLNRLANEASPYLRDHADNPVDWYPWGEEAFEKAQRENKPILLSIGYSTCLYCHVMERESYSDTTIAKFLNTHFVAIKVDKERRPDIDETYILATQLFSQISGWPNNVFLTPDLKPFHGGLYVPAAEFLDLLKQINTGWTSHRNTVLAEADRAANLIDQVMSYRREAEAVTPDALSGATKQLLANFDAANGGFGRGSKFTSETLLLLLLHRAETLNDIQAFAAATATLDAMVRGGIRDHVGGAFHRYTVDPTWRIPNHETILFNQAGVALALLQGYRLTAKPDYADAARQLLDFILRDMTAPSGGFYTSLDPELTHDGTKSSDGMHYTWTQKEFERSVGESNLAFAMKAFTWDRAPQFAGRGILTRAASIEELATSTGQSAAQITARLDAVRNALRTARTSRPAPRRDEKILSGWTGAMIMALADGAITLDEPRYRTAALKAAEFIWNDMGAATGTLKRNHFDGITDGDATQHDHAFVALGFVALHDIMPDGPWLKRARTIAEAMNKTFFDTSMNDYFISAEGGFYRPKMIADTEQPSGNAAAIELFAKLMRRDTSPDHRTMAERVLAATSGNVLGAPQENIYSLRAASFLLQGESGPTRTIANGRVRATATVTPGKPITVRLAIAPGWHVNSNKPLEDFFIPTKVTIADTPADAVKYPKSRIQQLKFHDKDLALLEGTVDILASPADPANPPKQAELTVQTCSNEICLEPETVRIPILRR